MSAMFIPVFITYLTPFFAQQHRLFYVSDSIVLL